MKILTIERSKWRRGGDARNIECGSTSLLNDKGLMCCLGFDAVACGLSERVIENRADPSEVALNLDSDSYADYLATRAQRHTERDEEDDYTHSSWICSAVASQAVEINDSESLTDTDREAQLIPVLKQLGYDDVQFVD